MKRLFQCRNDMILNAKLHVAIFLPYYACNFGLEENNNKI